MATTDRTRPTPPPVGARLSVRVDQALSDDLAVLLQTGCSVSDAIRVAVGHLADQHQQAWDHGVVPTGVSPRVVQYAFAPHRSGEPSDTASDTTGD